MGGHLCGVAVGSGESEVGWDGRLKNISPKNARL
jgi:hypothetical protein